MAQLLRALNTFAGDSGLLPRTHLVANNILFQFRGGGLSDALFRPPLAPDTRGAHTFMQAVHSYTENKNLKMCVKTPWETLNQYWLILQLRLNRWPLENRGSQYSFVFTYVPSTGTSSSHKPTVLP